MPCRGRHVPVGQRPRAGGQYFYRPLQYIPLLARGGLSISRSRRARDYWTPKNYDGGSRGTLTLRRALENSRNLATVHLLDGGIEKKPEASLDRVCSLAAEARIYRECERYYPFVLGAQPVRPIDLAAFYAAIANEGLRLTPHIVESIERNGATVYRHDPKSSVTIKSVDTAAFYQLKTMMQGVLARLAENDLKPWSRTRSLVHAAALGAQTPRCL
jgi:penicillin-binding protein 1A